MDGTIVAVVIVGVINASGWIYTRAIAMGRLNGKVESLSEASERHEKVLSGNGITQELSALKAEVAGLTGTLNTYINLTTKDR